MKRFVDKVALVTGAGGGIGSAISARLAAEGAYVVVADIDFQSASAVAARIVKEGGHATAVATDVSKSDACRSLVDEIVAERGHIDVLVNNAGIVRAGNIQSVSEADWHLSFRVNLDSMFFLSKASIPHMIARGGGAIVNIGSQWGLKPAPEHIAYATTKGAIASFTQSLARDYAPQKIRVNAVCPGEIRTPMLELVNSDLAVSADTSGSARRPGKPEDVASLVAYLASEEAAYVCGALVDITGAQTVS